MTILFSVSEQAFYDDAIPYPSFPDDIIEVSPELHMELLKGMNEAGSKVYLSNGIPTLSDPAPDSWHTWDSKKNKWTITKDGIKEKEKAEKVALENEKNNLIRDANDYINSKQWPSKLALGRLKDSEKAEFNLWLDYLDSLDAVDLSTPSDVKWPEQPAK